MQQFDIIGDVHGHADMLVKLLAKMGYELRDGIWRHAERQAVFVGDFVDIGPKQVETVMLVRRMVESGAAFAVLGNHDLNAIAWYLPDPRNPGDHLRSRYSDEWGKKNRHQHAAFLAEVEDKPDLHREIIEWFLMLPLWLELGDLRVVHACWHSKFIDYLAPKLLPGARLSEELMCQATHDPGGSTRDVHQPSIFSAVETLTKGIEIPLPAGNSFLDKYGIARSNVRLRWWRDDASTYQNAAILDDSLRESLSDKPLPQSVRGVNASDHPLAIGHYWLIGSPSLLTERIACVDYSVAHGGPLCAYRWQGEVALDQKNFCIVAPNGL